jgi:hypothetical protein
VKLDWIYAEIAEPSYNDFQWARTEEVHVLFCYPLFDLRTEIFDRKILETEEIWDSELGEVPVLIDSNKQSIGPFYFITLLTCFCEDLPALW